MHTNHCVVWSLPSRSTSMTLLCLAGDGLNRGVSTYFAVPMWEDGYLQLNWARSTSVQRNEQDSNREVDVEHTKLQSLSSWRHESCPASTTASNPIGARFYCRGIRLQYCYNADFDDPNLVSHINVYVARFMNVLRYWKRQT